MTKAKATRCRLCGGAAAVVVVARTREGTRR
jgi:hypothetical protein